MKRMLFVVVLALGLIWTGQPTPQAQTPGQCTVSWTGAYGTGLSLSFRADGTGQHPTNAAYDAKVGQVTVLMQYTNGDRTACKGKGWTVSTPDEWIKLTRAGASAAGASSVSFFSSNTVFLKADSNAGEARIGSATIVPTGGAVLRSGAVDTVVVNQEGAK